MWQLLRENSRLAFFVALAVLLCGGGLLLFVLSGLGGAGPAEREKVALPELAFDNSAAAGALENAPACETAALSVTAQTDKDSYAAGQLPLLSLTIENTGSQPCVHNVGTSQLVFEVQQQADTVWRSTDCQVNAEDLLVVLQPGKPLATAPLEWDRSRSTVDTCELQQRPEVPGQGSAYQLLVGVGQVPAQESKQFILH